MGWSILPKGWTWSDVGHLALDIGGLVPVYGEAADLANAAWLASKGQYLDAGLSLISMVPVVGDAVGKGGKLAKAGAVKMAGPALNALGRMNFDELLGPLQRHSGLGPHITKIKEALEKWRREMLDASPCTPSSQNCPVYQGRAYGGAVHLPGVDEIPVSYTRRPRAQYTALRDEFDNSVRGDFARDLVSTPEGMAALRQAGIDDAGLARLRQGQMPGQRGEWSVHHKLPLDDNGTNDFTNLVLIKNNPSHTAFTNAQRNLTSGMAIGETRTVNFPVPRGRIYPP